MAKATGATTPTVQSTAPVIQPTAPAPALNEEEFEAVIRGDKGGQIVTMTDTRMLPGDSVCLLDRWVNSGPLAVCAGIITGIDGCDEGHFNVRLISDANRGDDDRNCLSVRVLGPNDAPRHDERYLVITRAEAARRLYGATKKAN